MHYMCLLIFYMFSNDTITQLLQSHRLCQHSGRERIWPVRLVWLLLHKFSKQLGNPLDGMYFFVPLLFLGFMV